MLDLNRLQALIQDTCLLDRTQQVLVAVSGGADSLFLLDILQQLEYPLIVAHLDHGLRAESEVEAEGVRQTAQSIGATFIMGKEDVRAFAKINGMSIEEAAREVRYRFLFQQAEQRQSQAVAVGHTADDQVETVLMHLLRGAGLSGLKGMGYRSLPNAWSQDIPLVRPLLGVWREQILTYLEYRGLQPAMDESNLDKRYFRNRLRHELIPYLESYNPRLRQVLWRMTEVLREDHTILTKLEDAAWETCTLEEGVDYIGFSAQILGEQPIGIQRRLLRRAINHLRPGLRNLDFEIVERGLGFLDAPARSGQLDLIAGLYLHLERDFLWLRDQEAELPESHWPQLPAGAELDLKAPGAISFPVGWRLQAEIEDNLSVTSQKVQNNSDLFQAWLDLDRLHLPLRVRARQPGDRFQPLGMDGHSLKLSDFMINVKLPRRARNGWPLVLSGDIIAWVPGFQISHLFRVKGDTKTTAHLQLKQEKP